MISLSSTLTTVCNPKSEKWYSNHAKLGSENSISKVLGNSDITACFKLNPLISLNLTSKTVAIIMKLESTKANTIDLYV
ncbi:hypothetical protein VA208B3_14160 [Vibrio alginolyticus]|nr:hypothetical protein VA208B3_14160 [Vibrio alginolyticus]